MRCNLQRIEVKTEQIELARTTRPIGGRVGEQSRVRDVQPAAPPSVKFKTWARLAPTGLSVAQRTGAHLWRSGQLSASWRKSDERMDEACETLSSSSEEQQSNTGWIDSRL